jgi:hypothetical protein
VSPRTLAPAPPQDRRFWRLLLRRAHPDTGGSHDLFLWTQSVREYVAGDAPEEPPPRARRQPPPHPPTGEDRVAYSLDFEKYGSFTEVTQAALLIGETLPQPFSGLLCLLADCAEVGEDDPIHHRAQHVGATYRSLAALAHKAGFTKAERVRLYRIAEQIPLSERHCGHLHKKLAEQGGELDQLLRP